MLLISINFTPKTSHSCLKKWYTMFSRYTEKQPYIWFLLSQVVLGRQSEQTNDSPELRLFCCRTGVSCFLCFFFVPERCFLFPECFSFVGSMFFVFKVVVCCCTGLEPSRKGVSGSHESVAFPGTCLIILPAENGQSRGCLSFPKCCGSCNGNMPHHTPKSNSLQSMEPSSRDSNPQALRFMETVPPDSRASFLSA